jgi:predicted enzyme related to lactoylglutathione lyase
MARLNYLELPVRDLPAIRTFYSSAFGWSFTDFGPDYAATMSGDTDIGLNGSAEHATALLLPAIEVDNLEAAEASVRAAGGEITLAIFAFPGGRRFHFRDPAGHELGVVQVDPADG